jgi:hypothetical protein
MAGSYAQAAATQQECSQHACRRCAMTAGHTDIIRAIGHDILPALPDAQRIPLCQ